MTIMLDNVNRLYQRGKKFLRSLQKESAQIKAEEKKLNALRHEFENNKGRVIRAELAPSSVAKATFIVIGILVLTYFLYEIKHILILLAISAFLAVAFDPFVDRMQKLRIPRSVGILLIYLIFFGVTGLMIANFIPILATEIPKLATSILEWVNLNFQIDTTDIQVKISELQGYLADLQKNLNRENIAVGLDVLGKISQNVLTIIKSVAGGIFSFVIVLTITFFIVINENGIKEFLVMLFPSKYHNYILEKGEAIEAKFSAWVRGQLILMVVMGFLAFLALKIAGVNYAATLGLLAGLTEFLPYVGPILAFIPAVILAVSQGGFWLAVIVTLIYLGLQQLEGNVLVPIVMKKAVGLSPVVIIIAMLIGASFPETLNPIIGIIVSVPIATAASVFVWDYMARRRV